MSLSQLPLCPVLPPRSKRETHALAPAHAMPSIPAGEHVAAKESAGEQREVSLFDSALQSLQEASLQQFIHLLCKEKTRTTTFLRATERLAQSREALAQPHPRLTP